MTPRKRITVEYLMDWLDNNPRSLKEPVKAGCGTEIRDHYNQCKAWIKQFRVNPSDYNLEYYSGIVLPYIENYERAKKEQTTKG